MGKDIIHSIATKPIINFMTNENIIESSIGISTAMLAAMNFEKLYGIDQETDQPGYLNEEFENESLTNNNFGTIGGERKNKNGIKVEDSFEQSGIFEDQEMFEGLLGNTNIDYSNDQVVPEQSKFLKMIKKNNNMEQDSKNSSASSLDGFTFGLARLPTASTSLTYFPNLEADKKAEKNPIELDTESLTYLPGTPGSWMMEEIVPEGLQLAGIEEEYIEEELYQKEDNSREDFEKSKTICPFTKIIQKHAPTFSVGLIETAVQNLMIEVDPSSITIPHFQRLVIEKIEAEAEEVYNSDDDEEEIEECLICTEFLEKDLKTLEPCEHIFHLLCIEQWLGKDPSCPKCRAIVIQIE